MTTRSFGILAIAFALPVNAQSQSGGVSSLSQPSEAAMLMACGYESTPHGDPFGATSVNPNWVWDPDHPILFSKDRMKKAPYTNATCERYLLTRLYQQGNSGFVADRCKRIAKSLANESHRLGAGASDTVDESDDGLDFLVGRSSSADDLRGSNICGEDDVPDSALMACQYSSFKSQLDSPTRHQKNLEWVLGYCKQHGINIVIREPESYANSGIDVYGNGYCGVRAGGTIILQQQPSLANTITNGLLGALKVGLPIASMTYISALEQKNARQAINNNYRLGFPSMVNAGSMGAGYGYGYGYGGYGYGGYNGYGYGNGGYGYNPYGYAHGNGGMIVGGAGYPYGGVLGGGGCGLCSGGGMVGGGGGGYYGGLPYSAAVGGTGNVIGVPMTGNVGGIAASPCGIPPYAAGYTGCGAGGGGVMGGGLLGGGGIPSGAYYGPYGAGIYGNGMGGMGAMGGVPGPAGTLSGNNGYPAGYGNGMGYGMGGYPGGYSYPGASYGFPNGGGSFNPTAVAAQAQMYQAMAQQIARQAQQSAQIGKLYSNQLKDQQAVSDKQYQTYSAYQMASMGLGSSVGYGSSYGYGSGSYFGSSYYPPYSSMYGSTIGAPPATGTGLNVNFSGSFGR